MISSSRWRTEPSARCCFCSARVATFSKVASQASAKSCADRHKLLPRVGEVGDRRALAYLKVMNARSGCGRRSRDDCFPCLRKDAALEQAIQAIEKRLGEKP